MLVKQLNPILDDCKQDGGLDQDASEIRKLVLRASDYPLAGLASLLLVSSLASPLLLVGSRIYIVHSGPQLIEPTRKLYFFAIFPSNNEGTLQPCNRQRTVLYLWPWLYTQSTSNN